MKTITQPPANLALTPDAVAEMLTRIAGADRLLADALAQISVSRTPVSAATVALLEQLLTALRPAASERDQLTEVDRPTLRAGIRLWARRMITSPSPVGNHSGVRGQA